MLFSCSLFVFAFTVFDQPVFATKTSSEQMTEKELEAASKSDGVAEVLKSKANNSIGVEGLRGMKLSFIIHQSPNDVYIALKQIERYPEFSERVKRAEVIRRSSDGMVVEYTESALGFEMTATQEWTFDSKNHMLTMKNIGVEDKTAFQEILIQDVGHPEYARVVMTFFADISWLPNFAINWATSMIGKETVILCREMVPGILKSQIDNPKQ